jgi:hypothetical protein
MMYQYTIDNPNSICARGLARHEVKQTNETAAAIIRDNLTVCLISERIDLVIKQMKFASAPLSRLNEIVPDTDRIKSLTKILYK